MNRWRVFGRYLIPAVIFFALIGFFVRSLHLEDPEHNPSEIPSPLLGRAAPIFRLAQVEDRSRTISNQDFAGQVYVLNVWGTWCAGCRQEHQTLLQIAQDQSHAVPIIGLNWKDDFNLAARWLAELGNPYAATGFDPDGRAGIDWGVYGAPETFLVDAKGIVRFKHIAPMTLDVWQREFLPRIRQLQAGGSS